MTDRMELGNRWVPTPPPPPPPPPPPKQTTPTEARRVVPADQTAMATGATALSEQAHADYPPLAFSTGEPGTYYDGDYQVARPIDVEGVIDDREGGDLNRQITEDYARLDQMFQDYIGKPPIANWTSVGKHAAKEAGDAIRELERAIEEFDKLSVPPSPSEIKALFDALRDGDQRGYVIKLLKAACKENGVPFPDDFKSMCEFAKELASNPGKLGKMLATLREDMAVLYEGMVATNAKIYEDFQAVFDTFLKAEAQGLDGVEAVKAAIAAGELEDPSGLLVEALTLMQRAHRLSECAKNDPDRAHIYLAERAKCMERANVLIGLHEQYHVAQAAFDQNPRFAELMAMLTPEMEHKDANGTTELLPDGGNWAEFEDRMGLVPATEAEFTSNTDPNNPVFRVMGPDGEYRYYKAKPDDELEGTVLQILKDATTGEDGVSTREYAS